MPSPPTHRPLAPREPRPFTPLSVNRYFVDNASRGREQRLFTPTAVNRYLVDKAPGRIGTRTLPFEGKNIVVYSLPESGGGGEGEGAMLCEPCE